MVKIPPFASIPYFSFTTTREKEANLTLKCLVSTKSHFTKIAVSIF